MLAMSRADPQTHSANPDASWLDVEVHEIVYDPTLQVVLQSIDDDLASNVDNFAVRQIMLVFIKCLVDSFVHSYPLSKVLGCLLRVLPSIVRARRLDFLDVTHDQIFVITFALNEKSLNVFGITSFLDPAPP